jgi:hypothetical protein
MARRLAMMTGARRRTVFRFRPPMPPLTRTWTVRPALRAGRSFEPLRRAASWGGRTRPCNSNSADAAASAVSNRDGFRRFEALSRSPLHHRVGLPLLSFMNEGAVGEQIQRMFPHVQVPEWASTNQHVDRALGDALRAWKLPGNSALTEAIVKAIERALPKSHGGDGKCGGFTRWRVMKKEEEEENAHADYDHGASTGGRGFDVLLERHNIMDATAEEAEAEAATTPALAVQVGRRNDAWWITLNDGMNRVLDLGTFTKPFLLVVLTLRERRFRRKKFVMGSARVGVFLVTPRSGRDPPFFAEDNFRLSLLWRGLAKDVDTLSRDFGTALRTALLLPSWNAAAAPTDYACLGPNCCRVGSKVHRLVLYGRQNLFHRLLTTLPTLSPPPPGAPRLRQSPHVHGAPSRCILGYPFGRNERDLLLRGPGPGRW